MKSNFILVENHNQLINFVDIIHKVIPIDCMIGVTDLNNFLTYMPGEKIKVNLRRGSKIKKGDAIYESLQRKEKIVMEVPEQIYGFPFFGVGIPIVNDLNNIIGSFGIGINKHEFEATKFCNISELSINKASNFFVFEDQAMRKIYNLCLRVAPYNSPVLITGESGVGKEVIAKIIHENGLSSNGPFLQINCGAIPINLLETELFGYEHGAFTGAQRGGKIGIIEKCNNGTLLLDEIGDLHFDLQVKILRVIQEQEILRIGATTPRKINVRFFAATNKNLEEMMVDRNFRSDLFYRLNVIPIHIPPLREREDDILPLALNIIKKINHKYGKNKILNKDVLNEFKHFSWPGNIREMENLIERLVVISDDDIIGLEQLAFCQVNFDFRQKNHKQDINIEIYNPMPYKEAIKIMEKKLLAVTLSLYPSARKAAEVLGVSHPTIVRKANQYKLIKDGKYIVK